MRKPRDAGGFDQQAGVGCVGKILLVKHIVAEMICFAVNLVIKAFPDKRADVLRSMSAILASSSCCAFFLRRGFEIGDFLDRYAKLRKKLRVSVFAEHQIRRCAVEFPERIVGLVL